MWHVFCTLLVCDLIFCAAFIGFRCYCAGMDKEAVNACIRVLNSYILLHNKTLN